MLLEIIVQLLIEFFLGVISGLILDVIFPGLLRIKWFRRSINAVSALLFFFGLGVCTGFLSLLFFPLAFVKSSILPGISLVVTPTIVGLTMGLIGWLRRREGKLATQLESFLSGFSFGLGTALVRFYFTD